MAVAGEFLLLAAGGRLYIFLLDFLISSSNSGWGRWLGFFGVDFCLVFFESNSFTLLDLQKNPPVGAQLVGGRKL